MKKKKKKTLTYTYIYILVKKTHKKNTSFSNIEQFFLVAHFEKIQTIKKKINQIVREFFS